jgi:hypothetical protein
MGWMGPYSNVKHVLRTYGCDFQGEDPLTAVEDERGVHTPGPAHGLAFFMNIRSDNSDVVVDDNVRAFIGGQPAGTVASYMNSTSYGVRNIKVI